MFTLSQNIMFHCFEISNLKKKEYITQFILTHATIIATVSFLIFFSEINREKKLLQTCLKYKTRANQYNYSCRIIVSSTNLVFRLQS